MHIEEIYINNFRNIINEKILPENGINIFIGNNAQGKTNFLESIYVISNLKSFRGKKLSEIINYDSDKTKINLKIKKNKVLNTIKFEIEKNIKNIYLNNKKPNRVLESLGFLDTILFFPDDIFVVKGSPSLRRSLIDRAIFQTDNSYLYLFQDYLRCLKQRNAALKEKNSVVDLWDDQFIDLATRISFSRTGYIERINKILAETFKNICQSSEIITIKYQDLENDFKKYSAKFRNKLILGKEKERLYGMTLIGPHRDDIQFLLNGQLLSQYASQGQQRSFMLAFKTAQLIDFKNNRGVRPVLLLDDMTSELDERRKDAFFESLLDLSGQVFITSTETDLIKHRRFFEAKFFQVEKGKIAEIN